MSTFTTRLLLTALLTAGAFLGLTESASAQVRRSSSSGTVWPDDYARTYQTGKMYGWDMDTVYAIKNMTPQQREALRSWAIRSGYDWDNITLERRLPSARSYLSQSTARGTGTRQSSGSSYQQQKESINKMVKVGATAALKLGSAGLKVARERQAGFEEEARTYTFEEGSRVRQRDFVPEWRGIIADKLSDNKFRVQVTDVGSGSRYRVGDYLTVFRGQFIRD